MMRPMLLITLTVALVVPVDWFAKIKVPENSSNPWKVKLLLGGSQLCFAMGQLIEPIMGKGYGLTLFKKLIREFPRSSDSNIEVSDKTLSDVKVRLFVPRNKKSDRMAAIFYIHGGGWVLGSAEGYDPLTRNLANATNTLVVSVSYRLAPQHKYPSAIDDCEIAYRYFVNNADEYNIDPHRIAVAGDSAGGNLAAALVLKLRDERFKPMPKQQVLIYPALQPLDTNTPSYQQHGRDPILTSHLMSTMWLAYARGSYDNSLFLDAMLANLHTSVEFKNSKASKYIDHIDLKKHEEYYALSKTTGNQEIWNELKDIFLDPYFAPLMANDVTSLPETYILTVEQDILRDDGILYTDRLRKAGNILTHVHYTNAFHGILSYISNVKDADTILKDLVLFLDKGL